MEGKLTEGQMDLLEVMIGSGPKHFKLLYSITRDACNATEFHQRCDNQGPTVTVLYNPQGSVYGGYAGLSWQSSGGHFKDDTSFIFQLMSSGEHVVKTFRPTQNSSTLYFAAQRSADFNDLVTFTDSVCRNEDGTFNFNGRIALGNSYKNNNISNEAINNGNMVVTEMEVYAVSGADGKKRHRPWRKCSDFSDEYIKLLTEELAPLRPPNGSDVTNFCLLLIGPISGGKSSFINAVLSAFAGKVIQKVAVGESEQGVTKRYVPYQVRQADGSLLRFHLYDTPGLGESSGMDAINLHFLLDGHLPHSYEFSPYRHVSLRSVGFISKPTLAQEIHSVALVLDASTVSDLSPTIKCMINDCKRLILEKGIQLVVILTKIDKLHKDIADDLADVFKHQVVNAAVEKVSEMLGIPPNNVFPVKNYHSEVETEVAVHAFALMALRKLICMASDVLEERTNDSDDRTAGSGEVKESDTA